MGGLPAAWNIYENIWNLETMGNHMKIYEYIYIYMRICENIWKYMKSEIWKYMKISELDKYMKTYNQSLKFAWKYMGHLWKSHEARWKSMQSYIKT